MLVTVIIPMYNSEKYIRKCLDSVVNQTYKDLEVIIVDDGSTDGSGLIADEYGLRDDRFFVIHQDNHGLVYSRKRGIERAGGEYVLSVDSDDWLDENAVDELVDLAQAHNADVVASGARKVFFQDDAQGEKESCTGYSTTNGNVVFDRSVEEGNIAAPGEYKGEKLEKLKEKLFCIEDYCSLALLPYLWNKLWKRELIKKFVLDADERIRIGEDVAIGFPAIMASESLFVTNKAYYNYRQNRASMMRTNTEEYDEYSNAIRLVSYLKDVSKQLGYYEKIRNGLERLLDNQLFTRAYGMLNEQEKCKGLYPFTEETPSNLVIYGAGEFGKAVYSYASTRTSVKAWIDKNVDIYRLEGWPVITLEEYINSPEDTVIIAVLRKKSIEAITETLISAGIDRNQIRRIEITRNRE